MHSVQESRFMNLELPYGRVFQEEGIPVVQYYTSDPYKQGYAQGMLLGGEILELFREYIKPLLQALNAAPACCTQGREYKPSCELWDDYVKPYLIFSLNLCKDASKNRLLARQKEIVIPEGRKREMEGIVQAVNDYYGHRGTTLTMDDMINGHIFLDTYKKMGMAGQSQAFGCSAVGYKTGESAYLGRNLDWPDINGCHIGDYSFLSRRLSPSGTSYVTVDFPGMVGSLTGMSENLSVAICESGASIASGLPYNLAVRDLLENALSIEQARNYLLQTPIASSINLMAADKKEIALWQLDPQHPNPVQEIFPVENRLFATNHFVDWQNPDLVLESTIADTTSIERINFLKRTFESEMAEGQPVFTAMRNGLHMACEGDTIQRITMSPKDGVLEVSFDREWAAFRDKKKVVFEAKNLF
ncbi:C45 family autoproteolytic acyltransferase/hydolase [Estrella lausannensis]|uniref:Peptidase C45 hydrolase domain-containing protein n=1 Tax=Estrella lausannensis TaxID=483423 RepID=A0A0H5DMV1_9BACT|nr:C45 family peptidase [Estrella lausannensis]CRX37496.1 hypothetical protein ELAC_0134 [Estrella lausannensis]